MKKKLSNIEKAMKNLEKFFFEGTKNIEEMEDEEVAELFESKIGEFVEFFAMTEMNLFKEIGSWNDLADLKAMSTEFNLSVYKKLMELHENNKCPDCGSQMEMHDHEHDEEE